MNRVRQLSAAGLLGIVMIFELAAFALLSLRDESFDYKALAFAGGLIVVLLLQYIIILWISKYADRFILVIANLLAGIGMIVQYRLSYEVAFKQLVWFGIGIVAMIVCVLLMRAPKFFKTMDIPLMALSIAMLGARPWRRAAHMRDVSYNVLHRDRQDRHYAGRPWSRRCRCRGQLLYVRPR